MINDAICGTATISPVKTKSITIKLPNLLFWHDMRERRVTPLGFSKLTPLPGLNADEFPSITPLANRASNSANPDLVICLTFIQTNYEVLESLLRDRRRQVCNEDLRIKLDYYNEEYDEEREMEPRPTHVMEATPVLYTGSL
nr:hypothetical protein [Tanacetum cinerariifolium]